MSLTEVIKQLRDVGKGARYTSLAADGVLEQQRLDLAHMTMQEFLDYRQGSLKSKAIKIKDNVKFICENFPDFLESASKQICFSQMNITLYFNHSVTQDFPANP